MFDINQFPSLLHEELSVTHVTFKAAGQNRRCHANCTQEEVNAVDPSVPEKHLHLPNAHKLTLSSRVVSPENALDHLAY